MKNCRLNYISVLLSLLLLTSLLASCVNTPVSPDVTTPSEDQSINTGSGGNTESTPPEQTETRISFIAAGDNIMHDSVIADARARAADGEKYNFAAMYAGVASLISDADVAFVNQEGPVAGSAFGAVGYPDFNAPNEVFDNLEALGFDVVNLANNHMLDKGAEGLRGTIQNAASYPFLSIGGYTSADYDTPRVLEKNGVRIAFLSYTTLINYAHMNDLPASYGYVIPYAEEATIRRQVAAAKATADFVLVSMHWGDEDEFEPNAKQRQLAQLCADLGVDAVIGHHPHVVEPIEWVNGANGGKTLVVYSLGNLISTMYYSQNMVGGLISFDLVRTVDGKTSVENPLLTPTVCHYSLLRDALQVFRLEDYSEDLAAMHGSTLKNSFSYAILERYITDTVATEFLPEFLH